MENVSVAEMAEPTHIDARLDSEAANKAIAEVLQPVTDVPLIDPPPDGSVKLPGGYIHPSDGKLYVEAEVRELNGADEEALAKPEVGKSLGRFTQLLLQRGVTRIGPFDNPSNNLLGSLLIGDRDMLLLAIRIATYGPKLEMSIDCPACSEAFEVEYDLRTDIPIKTMDDPTERVIPVKLRDGTELQATLTIGTDQEAVLNAGLKATVPELNTLYLSRCLTMNGRPLGVEEVRRLGIQDRRQLLDVITDKQPGPQYQKLDLECPTCAKEFPLTMNIMDLFR